MFCGIVRIRRISQLCTTLLVVSWWLSLATLANAQDAPKVDSPKAYTEVVSESELLGHLINQEWDLALQLLQEEPEAASVLIEQRDISAAIVLRHLPLHQVFLSTVVEDQKGWEQKPMSTEHIQLIQTLIRLNPRAALQKDLKKRTPLHLALASSIPPPVEIIQALLRAYPHAVKARDNEERLPLHSAVAVPMTTFDNVQVILNAYPGAIDVMDEDDALPLHLAAWGGGGPDAVHVIRLLVSANPSSVSVRDGDEETPLMLMAKYGRTSIDAVRFMLEQDPHALATHRDEREGNTPLHFAVSASHGQNNEIYLPFLEKDPKAAQKINRIGKLPLHAALMHYGVSFKLVQNLLEAFPRGASLRDGNGYLPLHQACEVGVLDVNMIKLLVEKSPDSVRQRVSMGGSQGPLPLHLALAAEGSDQMNDSILFLLQKYPDAAKIKDPNSNYLPLHMALLTKRPSKILKKLMLLTPDDVPTVIDGMEGDEPIRTSAFHILMSTAPTYLNEEDTKEMVKAFLTMDPDGIKRQDGMGRLPLHIVWKSALVDEEFVKSRQVIVDALLEAYPEGAKALDRQGRPPVAYASTARDADAVERLLVLYPEMAHVKSHSGLMPLHYACGVGLVDTTAENIHRIITLLLKEYPIAASEQDSDGEVPLVKMCSSAGPDHLMAETIEALIDAYPIALRMKGTFGYFPLHMAAQSAVASERKSEHRSWVDLVRALLKEFPEAAAEPDNNGLTPFTTILQKLETLSHTRREEDDFLLQILRLLYDVNPESVLESDGRGRNGLHFISSLLGDLGGMMPKSWKDFALQVMYDFPELVAKADKFGRTPLHVFVLYLGDTAIGSRKQDKRTRRLIGDLEVVLHTMVALYPEGRNDEEEYGLTPHGLITHERLRRTRGSLAYKRSGIIKMVKRVLERDDDYWQLAARLERSRIQFGVPVQQQDEASRVCDEMKNILEDLRIDMAAALDKFETESAASMGEFICGEDMRRECSLCPEQVQMIDMVTSDLRLLASANDALHEESE